MKQTYRTVLKSLAVGLAGSVCAASLLTPVSAAGGVTGTQTHPTDPNISIGNVAMYAADLILEDFDVVSAGNGYFTLTATLRNGRVGFAGYPYPGGGKLKLHRTSGGTILQANPHPWQATPDQGTVLANKAIPMLLYGQAITVSATTHGRAIFSAFVDAGVQGPDTSAPTLPEGNPNNNSKTVNNLIAKTVPINTTTLNLALGSLIGQFQARIDDEDSFVRLPGLFDKHFAIPAQQWDLTYPVGIFPFFYIEEDTLKYWVNDINSNGVTLAFENGGLSLCVNFETNGSEIMGTLDSWDWAAPDVNTPHLKVCLKLPLQYNAWSQCFGYSNPQVTVDANWQFNGVGQLVNGLIPDINGRVSDGFEEFLSQPAVKEKIEFELNKSVRDLLLKGGRILNATIGASQITLNIEAGA